MKPPARLHSVQALRALAAASVVVDHALTRRDGQLISDAHAPLGWQLGAFGVSVFFVISGLIMVHTAMDLPQSIRGALTFIERRVKRIGPLYWCATLVAMIALLHHHTHLSIGTITASFGFVAHAAADHSDRLRPLLGQGWTLNYEMFFYVLFALGLLLPRRLTTPALCVALVIIVAIGAFLKSLLNTGDPTTLGQFYTDPIILLFGAGAIIGEVLRRRELPKLLQSHHVIALYVVLLAASLFILHFSGSPQVMPLGLRALFALFAVTAVVASVMESQPPVTFLTKAIEHLGNASYSVYLFHELTFAASGFVLRHIWRNAPPAVTTVVLVAFALAVGSAVYALVEKPLTRWLRGKTMFEPKGAGSPA